MITPKIPKVRHDYPFLYSQEPTTTRVIHHPAGNALSQHSYLRTQESDEQKRVFQHWTDQLNDEAIDFKV